MTEEKKYVGRGGWRGGGRPKGKSNLENPKDTRLAFACTFTEKKEIEERAGKKGVAVSVYIREFLFKK